MIQWREIGLLSGYARRQKCAHQMIFRESARRSFMRLHRHSGGTPLENKDGGGLWCPSVQPRPASRRDRARAASPASAPLILGNVAIFKQIGGVNLRL